MIPMIGKARPTSCPSEKRLSRHSVLGDDERVGRHLESCGRCGSRMEELRAPGRIARAMATPAFPAEDRRRLRARVIDRAAEMQPAQRSAPARWVWIAWLMPALAAAVVLYLWQPPPPPAPAASEIASRREAPVLPAPGRATSRAVVQSRARARFTTVRPLPDEMVRLDEGRVSVAVASLAPGERFRVVTADAEVEVRGTAFDVSARGGRLTGVRVQHGRVDVTLRGRPPVSLGAGQTWPPPDRRPAPVQHRTPGPGERELEEAWGTLKRGPQAGAAAAFERAARAAGNSALAEDAWFWRAVALGRDGQAAAARDALERFLARYPQSPRAAEAAVMLGWLLLDAGDAAGARARFRAAEHDPSRAVRDSAREGLRAAEAR